MHLARFPRIALGHFPTPLEKVPRLSAALGGPTLYIKRDDCTGLATGGNKARQLELLVEHALAKGCDVLVTAGGPQSNHARTTAAAAARAGLGCVLVFNTDPPQRTEGNQLLDVILGAERRFVGPVAMDDLDAAVNRIADELWAAGRRPYAIPLGGSSALGASAYARAADEIEAAISIPFLHLADTTADAVHAAGNVAARAWCEAVVQRTPEALDPDESGLNPRLAGSTGDFGRRFVINSFRWLAPENI